MHILNTRPSHQSHHLTTLLQQSGHSVFELPLLDIQPTPCAPIVANDIDILIFQSSNAVDYFFQHNDAAAFASSTLIAIGSATRLALMKQGLHHVICPEHFSSEGLLAMPLLQEVAQKSIAIISGENPKLLLNKTLQQRGAIMRAILCYRRVRVMHTMQIVFPKLMDAHIDFIICTSGESLHHLLQLFSAPTHHAWLIERKLCVVNNAMKAVAIDAGFDSVFQAPNVTDEAIVGVINTQML